MIKGRKTNWKTHLGNTVTIEGISDEHLANTIQYLQQNGYHPIGERVLPLLKKEAKLRKLSEVFLSRAPFPYKDGQGNYVVWDYENEAPKKVGSYVRN